MSKSGSVAPTERINIVYRSQLAGQPEVELPLKMLLLSSLTGQTPEGPLEKRRPISVDKENFNEIMQSQALSVEIAAANRLQDDGDQLGATLRFSTLRDFTPEGIAHQVPELRALLELREALSALKSPLGNRPEFRKRIQAILSDEASRNRLLQELRSAKGSSDSNDDDGQE